MNCEFTNKLWNDIEPTLRKLHPISVSNEEKAFGIVHHPPTTGIILRNWVTFMMREIISKAEREAYHTSYVNLDKIKRNLNKTVVSEIMNKNVRYRHENKSDFFEKLITYKTVLCEIQNDEYKIRDIFI